jgi:hypothetical protein
MTALLLATCFIGPTDQPLERHQVDCIDILCLNGSRYACFWLQEEDDLVGRGWHLMTSDHPLPHPTLDGWCYEFTKRDGSLVIVKAKLYTVTWATEDYEARFRNGGGTYRPIGR